MHGWVSCNLCNEFGVLTGIVTFLTSQNIFPTIDVCYDYIYIFLDFVCDVYTYDYLYTFSLQGFIFLSMGKIRGSVLSFSSIKLFILFIKWKMNYNFETDIIQI